MGRYFIWDTVLDTAAHGADAGVPTIAPPDALRERLAAVQPDELAPRDALDLLYELKALAAVDARDGA